MASKRSVARKYPSAGNPKATTTLYAMLASSRAPHSPEGSGGGGGRAGGGGGGGTCWRRGGDGCHRRGFPAVVRGAASCQAWAPQGRLRQRWRRRRRHQAAAVAAAAAAAAPGQAAVAAAAADPGGGGGGGGGTRLGVGEGLPSDAGLSAAACWFAWQLRRWL